MKAWYKSKTLWANILTFLIAVLALPEVTKLAPDAGQWLLAASGVLNVALRFITTEPIKTQ